MRGYVYDNGFLVFADGMIRLDVVEAIKLLDDDEGDPIAHVYLDGNDKPVGDDDDDYRFVPMTPDEERDYRLMDALCSVQPFYPGDPNYRPPTAEASTGTGLDDDEDDEDHEDHDINRAEMIRDLDAIGPQPKPDSPGQRLERLRRLFDDATCARDDAKQVYLDAFDAYWKVSS